MKYVRWGLIGCGDIATRRVVPALTALENCQLIAVNRAQSDLLEPFARQFHIPKYHEDWHDLISDPDINAVYIATPVHMHAEQTIAALNAGKHVLCEKPMAMNRKECNRMIEACHTSGLRLGVAYYRHFYPVLHRIQAIIESGEIGRITLSQINAFSYFNRKPGQSRAWLLEAEQSGGGPMIDFGSHRIEVFIHLFGSIDRVRGANRNLFFMDRDVEDTSVALFDHHLGVQSILMVTHTVFEPKDTLDIYGTRGSIHVPNLNQGRLNLLSVQGERIEDHPPHTNIHQPMIEDYAEAVLKGRQPVVDGVIGREVTQIIDAVYGSA